MLKQALFALTAVAATTAISGVAHADNGYVCSIEIWQNYNRTEVVTWLTTQPNCQGGYLFGGAPVQICGDLGVSPPLAACDGMRMTDAATVALFSKLLDSQHRKQQLDVFRDKLNHLRQIYFNNYFAP